MSMVLPEFDRDFGLAELLWPQLRGSLDKALTKAIGRSWRLLDEAGSLVSGSGIDADALPVEVRLYLELEPIGSLQATGVELAQLEGAAAMLDLVLVAAHCYQMAASLHLQAVNADYEALQHKHDALQTSEARFRELNALLDQRVREQVGVIELTQRQLYQSEKMASIGTLAAGMAHEINNPIGFIRSNMSTASKYVDRLQQAIASCRQAGAAEILERQNIDMILEDFPALLAESISGADRIAQIVANLKAYSSIDCLATEAHDMNDSVRAAAGVVCDQLPAHVAIYLDLQALPSFSCDPGRMNQVMFALLQNARHALAGKGGEIRIASACAGGEIRIAVSDNGCGVAPNILARIFDPFFTTRDVGKGIGLGLTVSKDIVQAHGGRLECASENGSGSTFTVCLPLAVPGGTQ